MLDFLLSVLRDDYREQDGFAVVAFLVLVALALTAVLWAVSEITRWLVFQWVAARKRRANIHDRLKSR